MTDRSVATSCGEIALSNLADWVNASPHQENRYLLPLPATNVEHAKIFLEGLGEPPRVLRRLFGLSQAGVSCSVVCVSRVASAA
jgi:hypothetical protein